MRGFRNVPLVRRVLRAEDRLLARPQELSPSGTSPAGGPAARTVRSSEAANVARPTAPQPVEDDASRRRRERRYERALTGWLASRLRAGARRRRIEAAEPDREGA